MQHEVIRKLQDALWDIETEAQVVYILVQTRKLIEHLKAENRYQILESFCSWALHTKMDKADAQAVLKVMDKVVGQYEKNKAAAEKHAVCVEGIFDFSHFYREMIQLLNDAGIKTHSLQLMPEWFKFAKLYASVILDIPLVYEKDDLRLMHVNRAIVHKYEVPEEAQAKAPSGVICPFGLRWTFYLDKDEVFYWDIPFAYEDFDTVNAPVNGKRIQETLESNQ